MNINTFIQELYRKEDTQNNLKILEFQMSFRALNTKKIINILFTELVLIFKRFINVHLFSFINGKYFILSIKYFIFFNKLKTKISKLLAAIQNSEK